MQKQTNHYNKSNEEIDKLKHIIIVYYCETNLPSKHYEIAYILLWPNRDIKGKHIRMKNQQIGKIEKTNQHRQCEMLTSNFRHMIVIGMYTQNQIFAYGPLSEK